jgi:hypothetical protein
MKSQSLKRRSAERSRTLLYFPNVSSLDDEILLAESHVASWLGVATVTLRGWRRRGRGPDFVRIENRPRYAVGAVRQWLAERYERRSSKTAA